MQVYICNHRISSTRAIGFSNMKYILRYGIGRKYDDLLLSLVCYSWRLMFTTMYSEYDVDVMKRSDIKHRLELYMHVRSHLRIYLRVF